MVKRPFCRRSAPSGDLLPVQQVELPAARLGPPPPARRLPGSVRRSAPVDIRPDRNPTDPDCLRCLDCTRCRASSSPRSFTGSRSVCPEHRRSARRERKVFRGRLRVKSSRAINCLTSGGNELMISHCFYFSGPEIPCADAMRSRENGHYGRSRELGIEGVFQEIYRSTLIRKTWLSPLSLQ